ncbi:MAG: hypothetical protein K8I29_00695 [Alphaproteobacteria bacterium]|uniref:Uncharacterized protein n=1 Tax=Candidatus Nitrobium versatile TaxID=2884831 RepID=A0A953LYT4_9BACT|nr:hypothetical protein [Candidatus Nitrobium versatile]
MEKTYLRKELRELLKSMDFVSNKLLVDEKAAGKDFQIYFKIYQQLGLAWEYLGQQCKYWDGYRKTREKHEVCKICGKVKTLKNKKNVK